MIMYILFLQYVYFQLQNKVDQSGHKSCQKMHWFMEFKNIPFKNQNISAKKKVVSTESVLWNEQDSNLSLSERL